MSIGTGRELVREEDKIYVARPKNDTLEVYLGRQEKPYSAFESFFLEMPRDTGLWGGVWGIMQHHRGQNSNVLAFSAIKYEEALKKGHDLAIIFSLGQLGKKEGEGRYQKVVDCSRMGGKSAGPVKVVDEPARLV